MFIQFKVDSIWPVPKPAGQQFAFLYQSCHSIFRFQFINGPAFLGIHFEQLLLPSDEQSFVQRLASAQPTVHNELRRNGVTLELPWEEY